MYRLIRPLLFSLDPEQSHRAAFAALETVCRSGLGVPLFGLPVDDPVSLLGLQFPNRVGLAAGLDKNAAHIDALAVLGFGFIEAGTFTPVAQPGNPRPRLFRLPPARALINRFGFNNDGVDQAVRNVRQSAWFEAGMPRPVLGLNIGKNASTPLENAHHDYLIGLRKVNDWADYITVNISSPNTKNLRQLQSDDALDALLRALDTERGDMRRRGERDVPVLLKIAPDLDAEQIDAIARALVRYRFDGVIATNTTIARDRVEGLPHGSETGGLSGAPVFDASNRVISALRQALPPAYPIIGAGGVMSAADAVAKRRAGADLVQLYTGLIYEGPGLVAQCARALARGEP